MKPTLRLLIVHTDSADAAVWSALLEEKWAVRGGVVDPQGFRAAIEADPPQVIVTGGESPAPRGGLTPWIVVMKDSDPGVAVDHLRAGATDCVPLAELPSAIERALARERHLAAVARQRSLDAVGRFAGRAGHDVNNLLTVVQGYGDLLLHELGDRPDLREAASEILIASERTAEFAGRLIALSPQRRCAPLALDLVGFLSSETARLSSQIGPDVSVSSASAEDIPRPWIDPSHLSQAIAELVANAAEALPSGGDVHLEAVTPGTDLPASLKAGRYVVVRVSDRGAGMDEESLGLAFEPFFTTKAKQAGSGLGLTLVDSLVRHAGGAVRIESRPGEGTVASLFLPQADSRQGARSDA